MNDKTINILEGVKNTLKGDKKIKIIVTIGFIGIALIFLSELFTPNEKQVSNKNTIKTLSLDTDDYKRQLEDELVSILTQISGVGKAKVMVTIEGTTEYIFAEEINLNKSEGSDQTTEQSQNKIVLIEKNGEEEALVKKILKPKITGVIVVCEGGDQPNVSEKVYNAVSTALGISSNRICVARG